MPNNANEMGNRRVLVYAKPVIEIPDIDLEADYTTLDHNALISVELMALSKNSET